MFNSLGQTLLKVCVSGVPDICQGRNVLIIVRIDSKSAFCQMRAIMKLPVFVRKSARIANEPQVSANMRMSPWIFVAAALLAISFVTGAAEAMFVPTAPDKKEAPHFDRAADMAKIQRVLESKTLQQRLVDYGLSPEKALEKINGLSGEQVHQLAARIDALQAGGMSSSSLIIILLLIVLILLLI